MKQKKRVTTRRKKHPKKQKIVRLRASAGGRKPPLELTPELAEYYRAIKKPVTLRLDADVVAWFQRQGRGYQTRINRALRKVMMDERKKSRK
ncbi:MAG: BrnA antitoxin family protein [Terriglobales bacterium]|jgi:uncharacterized protein (DUF4415 family)